MQSFVTYCLCVIMAMVFVAHGLDFIRHRLVQTVKRHKKKERASHTN